MERGKQRSEPLPSVTSETNLMRQIMLAVSKLKNVRIFRNNTGFDATNKVRYGLVTGSSDLIGWKSVTVTHEMVGQQVAVFVALEVKTPKGRATDEQKNFVNVVNAAGGKAAIVRSVSEGIKVLS
jgi:hypothetical protein